MLGRVLTWMPAVCVAGAGNESKVLKRGETIAVSARKSETVQVPCKAGQLVQWDISIASHDIEASAWVCCFTSYIIHALRIQCHV